MRPERKAAAMVEAILAGDMSGEEIIEMTRRSVVPPMPRTAPPAPSLPPMTLLLRAGAWTRSGRR